MDRDPHYGLRTPVMGWDPYSVGWRPLLWAETPIMGWGPPVWDRDPQGGMETPIVGQ